MQCKATSTLKRTEDLRLSQASSGRAVVERRAHRIDMSQAVQQALQSPLGCDSQLQTAHLGQGGKAAAGGQPLGQQAPGRQRTGATLGVQNPWQPDGVGGGTQSRE